MRLAREKKEVFGEMSTPPPQPPTIIMHGIVKRGREERFRKQCSKEKLFYLCPCTSRTILFFTFSRFYSISLRRYPSSSPCQFQSRPSPSLLSNQSILRLSGDRKRKDEGSPLSCRLSSSSSLKRFPEKNVPRRKKT